MTEDHLELLRDKFVLWARASREGPMDSRDYNRRAASALQALLSEQVEFESLNTTLASRLKEAQEGLREIACFGDSGAERHLQETGSYSYFDEPSAVATSREILLSIASIHRPDIEG